MDIAIKDEGDTEEQEARTFLRERFLKLISKLSAGTECEVKMHENTSVQCKVKGFDNNFQEIIVENLKTPLPTPINKAVIRTSDIISMKFNCDYSKYCE